MALSSSIIKCLGVVFLVFILFGWDFGVTYFKNFGKFLSITSSNILSSLISLFSLSGISLSVFCFCFCFLMAFCAYFTEVIIHLSGDITKVLSSCGLCFKSLFPELLCFAFFLVCLFWSLLFTLDAFLIFKNGALTICPETS